MGNILLGIELKKPLVLMPRFAEKKETRNNHQVDTVKWLEGKGSIGFTHEIANWIDPFNRYAQHILNGNDIRKNLHGELIETIRDYVNDD